MQNISHVQDADKLLDFFSNDKSIYESQSEKRGLISFCLEMLNVPTFDIKEIEASLDDLRSIVQIISNELTVPKREEFNNVVSKGINRYDKWLHSVSNGLVREDMAEDLLFDEDALADIMRARMSEMRKLPEGYIRVVSDWTGYKSYESEDSQLDDESSMRVPVSPIVFIDGNLTFCEKSVKWSDSNLIGLGDIKSIEGILSAKYRKNADKRLIAILSECYKKLGKKLCYKILSIESGSLKAEDSYVIDTKTPDKGCFMSIRKKPKGTSKKEK